MKDGVLTLSDGRHLGYREYGDPTGLAICLLHGTPGSRVFGLEHEPMLSEEHLRVITPERPGYGLSSPFVGRRMSDFSNDVEALADHLGLPTFHVAGVSGGGPYVLACASSLPGRVRSASLIASAAPMQTAGFFDGMSVGNKVAFSLSRYAPFLLKPIYQYAAKQCQKHPEKLIKGLMSQVCEWDRAVIDEMTEKDRLEAMIEHIREAYRQGYAAAYTDLLLLSRAWGIDYATLSCPVFVWHGESDTLMPITPVRAFAKTLPNCQHHFIEGAGHLLLESEEIGRRIIQAIKQVA